MLITESLCTDMFERRGCSGKILLGADISQTDPGGLGPALLEN